MELSEQDISLFDSYLEGSLSGDALSKFQSRLESDAEYAAEFEAHQDFHNAMRQHGRKEMKSTFGAAHTGAALAGYNSYSAGKGLLNSIWKWLKTLFVSTTIVAASIYGYQTIKPQAEFPHKLKLKTPAAQTPVQPQVKTEPVEVVKETVIYTTTYIEGDSAELERLIELEKERMLKENPNATIEVQIDDMELDRPDEESTKELGKE